MYEFEWTVIDLEGDAFTGDIYCLGDLDYFTSDTGPIYYEYYSFPSVGYEVITIQATDEHGNHNSLSTIIYINDPPS